MYNYLFCIWSIVFHDFVICNLYPILYLSNPLISPNDTFLLMLQTFDGRTICRYQCAHTHPSIDFNIFLVLTSFDTGKMSLYISWNPDISC